MARARGELAEANGAQLAAHRLLRDREAELVPDPLDQVDDPPAHDAMHGRDWPVLDDLPQGRALRRVEPRLLARRLARRQPGWALRVEPENPITHGLKPDPADGCRRRASLARVDRRHRQKAADLPRIAARSRPP